MLEELRNEGALADWENEGGSVSATSPDLRRERSLLPASNDVDEDCEEVTDAAGEHVVPSMERALAEIPAEIEPGLRPLQSDCREPQRVTVFPGVRIPRDVRLPVARQANTLSLSTLAKGLI